MEIFKLPKDRIGVIVGKNGQTKRKLEEYIGTKITVDSKMCEVLVSTENIKSAIMKLKLSTVINAIGAGFSAEKSFLLFSDDYYLETIRIKSYVKSGKHIRRLKSRVIGTKGKTRKIIERNTDTYISVYGSTVSIIGKLSNLEVARNAVDMLLRGSEHSTVYRYLQRERDKLIDEDTS